jgi:parallel beta-helix repeat protein
LEDKALVCATRLGSYSLTALALVLLAQLLAVCAQGQIPITTCGTDIKTPGQYYLANDLNCQSGDAAITIERGDVTLNLNHHQITGPGAGDHIFLLGPGVIRNMAVGVRISSRGEAVFSRLTCTGNGNGFIVDQHVTPIARANTASENVYSGMLIVGSGGEIGGNKMNNNGYDGMIVGGSRNYVDHSNVAQYNRRHGIAVRGRNNVISRNTAQFNGEDDLFEDHRSCENLWENNTFNSANLPCIQ